MGKARRLKKQLQRQRALDRLNSLQMTKTPIKMRELEENMGTKSLKKMYKYLHRQKEFERVWHQYISDD